MEDALARRAPLGPPLERRSAFEVVYESVRYAILTGAFRGGQHLVQANLAESLGVSTTPVREALRDLASEGLVELDQHRGAVVRQVGLEEVKDIYEVRSVLEPLLARRAAERISEDQVDQLARLQDLMDGTEDAREWVELNTRFHGLIYDAAHWPFVDRFLRSLQAKAAIYVGVSIQFDLTQDNARFWPQEIRRGNAEHRELVKSFLQGGAPQVEQAMQRHIQSTIDNILERGPRPPERS